MPVKTPNFLETIQQPTDYKERLSHIMHMIATSDLDGIVLNPGPSLTYLTGLDFHLMERPVVALIAPNQGITLVIPELEKQKTSNLDYPLQVFMYGEDPKTWVEIFRRAAYSIAFTGNIGVEPTRLRYLELSLLKESVPGASFVSAENLFAELRIRKDRSEILKMQKAVEIAQEALRNTLPIIQPGISERQVATELTLQLLRAGSDPVLPFPPIVSGGPNSANPHASPSDRLIVQGDLLVIDWGAYYEGYCSDLTRTFAIGEIDNELITIAKIVEEANQAGREVAKSGIPASEVDRAAREVITQAGYGEYFTHRTGHGLGMEGHEAPYMRAGNEQILETGMAFTVEPGIYLPGKGGARIEDDVVITEGGSLSLSDLQRQIQFIPA